MRLLGRILCLLTALAVIEAPYLILQSYAWVTMIQERTPEMGFEAAVADTFSGAHPCEKCVALGNEREKKTEQAPLSESRQLSQLVPTYLAGNTLVLFPPSRIQNGFPHSITRSDLWLADVPCPPPWLG